MLKILFEHSIFLHQKNGGISKYICNLNYELNKNNINSRIYSPITINKGRRFDKLVHGNSVYCFVEKSTGDVYKSATWRQPYTKGNNCIRGSIYDTSTYWDKELKYGGWLYA